MKEIEAVELKAVYNLIGQETYDEQNPEFKNDVLQIIRDLLYRVSELEEMVAYLKE